MIIGEKVTLRPLELRDMALIAKWRGDPDFHKCFFSWQHLPLSSQGVWYDRYARDETDQMFIIEAKEKPVGCCAVYGIDKHHQKAELGRLLMAEEHGNGYARETLRLLLDYSFSEMNLNRVFVRVFAENEVALKLYSSVGFQREGTERESVWKSAAFRDIVVMSVLRKEKQ